MHRVIIDMVIALLFSIMSLTEYLNDNSDRAIDFFIIAGLFACWGELALLKTKALGESDSG